MTTENLEPKVATGEFIDKLVENAVVRPPDNMRSQFDGGENDPLIKNGTWDDIETLNIPSRFSLFIPNELNVVEAAIFYLLETRGFKKEYEEIARCLQWEIRKEQETRKLTARKNGDIL